MTNQEIGRSLASSFVEMAAALDKLPQVEADLAEAKGRVQFLESHNTDLGNQVVALEAKIADLEAKYADATKSASGHKANLDLLLDEVRKAVGQVAVAMDIVNPPPPPAPVEPEPIDLPNPLSLGRGDVGSSTVGQSEGPFQPSTESGQSGPMNSAETGPESGQSGGHPTVFSAPDTTSVQASPSVSSTDANTSPSDPRPYTDKPYWLKPNTMTWQEWKDGGGDVPYWVSSGEASLMAAT